MNPHVQKVIDTITTDPGAKLTLPDLADLAGVSPTHLVRLFRRATGTSPTRYRIKTRLNQAMNLLTTTDQTVTRITSDLGYSGEGHFRRLFTDATGMSPTAYRHATRTTAPRAWLVYDPARTRVDAYNDNPTKPGTTHMGHAELTDGGQWQVTVTGETRPRTYHRAAAAAALRGAINRRVQPRRHRRGTNHK